MQTCSLLLFFLGSSALDLRSVGDLEFLQSLESKLSSLLSEVRKIPDNFAQSLHASLKLIASIHETTVRVLLSFLDFVVGLVLLEKSNSASGSLL